MTRITEATPTPRWSALHRDRKAQAILCTLERFVPFNLAQAKCVDIGCGSGGIAYYIAPYVKEVTGIDPESWGQWSEFSTLRDNLKFYNDSVENLTIANSSIDIVICNQVYEHVPNPRLLISEIYRILKPGGYCYFAGPNLLFPIEPHVFWPFIHWLPRTIALRLMKALGSKSTIDANSTHYWALRKWLHQFEIYDAVPYIVKFHDKYGRSTLLWRILGHTPPPILRVLSPLSPTFVFLLRKPILTKQVI